MEVLTKKELINIQGGIAFHIGLAIVGIITFLIGVIDGYVRPFKCRN